MFQVALFFYSNRDHSMNPFDVCYIPCMQIHGIVKEVTGDRVLVEYTHFGFVRMCWFDASAIKESK